MVCRSCKTWLKPYGPDLCYECAELDKRFDREEKDELSWNHQHYCYVCKKQYDCSYHHCESQLNRCCTECINHFERSKLNAMPTL
jgi:hypothetical protein